MKDKRRRKKGKKSLFTAVITVILLLFAFIMNETGQWDKLLIFVNENNNDTTFSENETVLNAYFIDVGQGDCSLFISGTQSMLIDCGEKENADTVIQTISDHGIENIDYIVATHAHSDHIGAMSDIIDAFTVSNIIISEPSEDSASTSTYENFIDAVNNSNANVILATTGYKFSLGKADCTILAPFQVDNANENNNSVVMLIEAGETSFLMTGDAEKSVEKEFLLNYPSVDVDILKVGHHGSSTSSSDDFIENISPETAVIQCGLNNRYGHPTEKTIKTLDNKNIKYYRTDINGTITVHCFGDSYSVEVEK